MADKGTKGLSVSKSNFSEWYSEVIQKAGLADLRYNVKGFLVFQPWSVMAMENMYSIFEANLRKKGHMPYWFPTVIPEGNLTRESEHIKGFTPEVFWVTHGGNKEFEERLALRPTSETAFYQMFALWLRSYKDLPFKTYQRANVFRHETKATRPFLRSREFHWIETHCLHANLSDAEKQVEEDMQTTEEVLHDSFGLPFIFFQRPAWDKFPGADKTFAADVLNPDGKVVQQPSTHLISQSFLKGFGVSFKDKDGKDKVPYSTCYGPAISRIFASVIIVHGDDKGLRMPWSIAPYQIVIVPIKQEEKLMKKAHELAKELGDYRVHIDDSENSVGEKFNTWELKGVPLRIDLGERELKEGKVIVFRRDSNVKEIVLISELGKYIAKVVKTFDANLIKQADKVFDDRIKQASDMNKLKEVIESGSIAKCGFCSVDKSGEKCAEKIEKEVGAKVRGTRFDEKQKVSGKCVVCGDKAKEVVYVAREY
ncbi:MAG: proline--tRNA ligase [Nanoarchaeota archaeon]